MRFIVIALNGKLAQLVDSLFKGDKHYCINKVKQRVDNCNAEHRDGH